MKGVRKGLTYTTPLFAAWRHVWNADPAAAEAGQKADALATWRNRLLPPYPSSATLSVCARDLDEFYAYVASHARPTPGAEEVFLAEHVRFFECLRPLIDASRWPRWVLLERALEDASVQSDFILAALVLRTMIEDLRLHADLERCEQALAAYSLETSKTAAPPCHLVRRYAELLTCRLLPRLSQERQADRPRGPDPEKILPERYQALNDYVHPNYGSHVAVITPEDSQVGSLFCCTFTDIYVRFLALPWVKATPQSVPAPDGSTPKPRTPGAGGSEWDALLDRTLPSIRRTLERHRYGPLARDLPFGEFRRAAARIAEFTSEVECALADDAARLERTTAPLRTLCDTIAPTEAPHAPEAILRFPRSHPQCGFALEDWLVGFRGSRRCAKGLDECVQKLSPSQLFPSKPPHRPWIEMMGRAIRLTLTLGQLKQNAVRRATVRMLNQRNPLGAALCGRSLMEHYAVACWVSSNLARQWREVEERAQSGQDIKPALNELERILCRFLAGTKGTTELATGWRQRWADQAKALSRLTEIVNEAFPEENERGNTTYDQLSCVIHGEALRGGDLLEPGSELLVSLRLGQVASFTGSLMGPDATASVIGPAMYLLSRMTRPGGPADQFDAAGFRRAVSEGRLPDRLQHGIDFIGAGTEEDPFRFTRPLDHHAAVHAWCRQEGISPELFSAWPADEGIGTTVHASGGRRFWFAPSGPPWWIAAEEAG